MSKKLKLEFEKHQFRFDYEISAGDKLGDFTDTRTPTDAATSADVVLEVG